MDATVDDTKTETLDGDIGVVDKREAKKRKLEDDIKQKQAQLDKLNALEKHEKKKREDRVKVLAGACLLEMVAADPDLEKRFRHSFKSFLQRPHEKIVFQHFLESLEAMKSKKKDEDRAVA